MSDQSLRPNKPKNKDEGLWLLSFADLSCILIAFFVLLLSYSKVDQDKMRVVEESVKNNEARKTPQDNLEAVSKKLEEQVRTLKLEDKIKVKYDADGVNLELSDQLVFEAGSARPSQNLAEVMAPVLKLLGETNERYHLTLEGHTDDRPIKSREFSDNWELSASRGLQFLKLLEARGIKEDRMSVHAFAHTRPLVPLTGLSGLALEKARAKNRRVVVKIQ